MASISQGIVLTTAMVLSSTVLYLTFSKQKSSNSEIPDSTHSNEKTNLRSCLYSEEKKRDKRRRNKKKVKFSENVMVKEEEKIDTSSDDEKIIEEQGKKNRGGSNSMSNCRNEIPETKNHRMPANRVALYNGILRDRVHRMASCH